MYDTSITPTACANRQEMSAQEACTAIQDHLRKGTQSLLLCKVGSVLRGSESLFQVHCAAVQKAEHELKQLFGAGQSDSQQAGVDGVGAVSGSRQSWVQALGCRQQAQQLLTQEVSWRRQQQNAIQVMLFDCDL